MTQSGRVPWDYLALFALVVAPAHGGLALLIVLLLTSALLMRFALERDPVLLTRDWLVAGTYFLYFVYFYLNGAVIGGNIWAPLSAMTGNLVLVLLGLCALLMPRSSGVLTVARVGRWCRWSVLLTALLAMVLLAVAHSLPVIARDTIQGAWQGGIGGRLQMFSRNPLMFASMYLALSFLSLLGYRDLPPTQRKLALMALVCGLAVIMFWVQARGAMLVALPLAVLAILYLRPAFAKVLGLCLLVVLVSGVVYFADESLRANVNASVARLWAGILSLGDSGSTEDVNVWARFQMYRLGLEAAAQSPWWGYGYQNRFEVIRPFVPDFSAGHLHNGYLNHQVAGGVPGLALFLWFLMLPALLMRRVRPVGKDGVYAAMVCLAVMAGTALSTAVLGHYVHATFYGLLFWVLSRMLASASPPPSQAGARRLTGAV